jgi:hypothetical protein
MQVPTGYGLLLKRTLVAASVLCALSVAGCGDPVPDPTASRSDAQAAQLRERLRSGQGAN